MDIRNYIENLKGTATLAPESESGDLGIDVPDDARELTESQGSDTGSAGQGPDRDPDALASDPSPSRRRGRRPAPSPARSKIVARERKQIEDSISLVLIMLGGAWSMRDEACGPSLVDVAKPAAQAAVPIIARNPAWVAFFLASGGGFLEWIALASALSPFAATVWRHHGPGRRHAGEEEQRGYVPDDVSQYTVPGL